MRSLRIAFAVAVLAFATGAFASALSVSPDSFLQFSSELTMDLTADGTFGLDHNDVVFSGPGDYTQTVDGTASSVITFSVPSVVTITTGTWMVSVFAYDTPDGSPRVFGPASFSVIPLPQTDPPLISIPEFVLAAATSTSGAHATFSVSAQNDDGSPVPITCDHNSGDLFPLGSTNVHCSATNTFGTTTGEFSVFVADLTPPVMTLPADITTANPVVTYTVTAVDDLDTSPTVFCSPASGSTFAPGVTVVNCTATDNFANTSFGSFTVTVFTGPPTLTLPANITVEATSGAGAVVTYTATADENATVVCTPASGSTFALGTTTVNCSATNILNQTTTGSFQVTVVDTTPPTLTLPSNITPEATSPAGAAVTFSATATDLVDGTVTVICTPASGSTFPLGTTAVQCSATDLHNNSAHGGFNVTVLDTTPPEITSLTANPSFLWPDNHKMVDVTITGTATDLVDTHPTLHILSVASDQPVVTNGNPNQSPDWIITGAMTLQLRAERTNGRDRTYTITVAATDFSGNTSTATITVMCAHNGKNRAVGH
jgi:hypothetical protein